MALFQLTINCNWGNTRAVRVEIPDDDLEGLDASERRHEINEWMDGEVQERVTWTWDEVDQNGRIITS